MDSTTTQQLILVLTQQNMMLMQEVASLKSQLSNLTTGIVPETLKITKKTKSPVDPNKPKHPSHIETGKKLAIWNTNRKLVRDALRTWKESVSPQAI